MGTLSNMKVLMTANVETVIVFRSCAPLWVSFTDYCFYQRALPSRRSAFAMLAIFAGASVYVHFEQQTRKRSDASQEAYFWLALWFTLLIFQLTYGKQLVTGLGLQSIWSPVLYTNALALVPTACMGYLSGDYDRGRHQLGRLQMPAGDHSDGVHRGWCDEQVTHCVDQRVDLGQARVADGNRGALRLLMWWRTIRAGTTATAQRV